MRKATERVPGHRGARRLAAGSAAVGLVLAAGTIALAGPWDSGQRTAERRQAARLSAERTAEGDRAQRGGPDAGTLPGGRGGLPAVPPVLDPVTLTPAGPPGSPEEGGRRDGQPSGAAALARELGRLLDDPALGSRTAAAVVDVATGAELYDRRSGGGAIPASTAKLVSAAAALDVLGPDRRLATEAVWDRGRIVLVGGGDPTLTADDLRRLAERTARAAAGRGTGTARVAYDVSLYRGEHRHAIGVNTNIAPLTPLMVDAARLDGSRHGPAPRAADPAAEAAAVFAEHLQDAGLDLRGRPAQRTAAQGAERLAVHRSAPLSALVERMLTHSDNDLAEALGRHIAAARGQRTDADGVARALTAGLEDLGLPLRGVRIADASGLDRGGRVTADLLTRLLALAAEPGRPELRPVLTGMAVAGYSGTLGDRYGGGTAGAAGGGLVRAKTGTLTGVNTLAGTVTTPDGRVLAFAFLARGTADPAAARAALDAAAAALVA